MPTRVVRLGASAALVLAVAAPLAAQQGGFVTTLGRDTITVERFTRTPQGVSGELVNVAPRVRHLRYALTLGKNGQPQEFTVEQRTVNDTTPPSSLRMTFGADSTRLVVTQGGKVTTKSAPANGPAWPQQLNLVALTEYPAMALAKSGRDSITLNVVSLGDPKSVPTVFYKRGADTMSTMFFEPQFWMNYLVDKQGHVRGADGAHTTVKVVVVPQPKIDVAAFVAAAGAREKAGGGIGQLSKADSVSASAGPAALSVVYGRPAKRGRTVWGGVVPFGEVWRTGANAATRLHVSAPVDIGGTTVPAGDYSLWSVPTADGATLIVNKQSGQWGTEYHADRDLARIPVRVEKLGAPVEVFTMAFAGSGDADRMLVAEWDTVRWTVPVKAKP